MQRFLIIVDNISEWSGKVLILPLITILCILIYEVSMRYFFNAPTSWSHETSSQLFGVLSIIGGAYTLLHGRHVNVDLFYSRFQERTRAFIDLFTYLALFLFAGVILIYGWQFALFSARIHETSGTPFNPIMAPLKFSIPLGSFLIFLQGLAHWIKALYRVNGWGIADGHDQATLKRENEG